MSCDMTCASAGAGKSGGASDSVNAQRESQRQPRAGVDVSYL
jgi:hypothetical protein